MQPWFTVYFFDIGHPCYDQLTPVKPRYPLTSITCHMAGSILQFIEVNWFFKLTADQVLVFLLDCRLMSGKFVENRAGLFKSRLMLTQD